MKPHVENGLLFKSENENLLASEPPGRKQIVKTLEHREYLLKQFKELWYQEYLVSLRETCKDLHQIDFENKIQVNDVVLVKGPPRQKRPFWHFGRVVELIPGYDHKVRAVKILKGDGATGTIATHSLKHIFPMELSLTHTHQAMEPQGSLVPSDTAGSAEPEMIESEVSIEKSLEEADEASSIVHSQSLEFNEQVPDIENVSMDVDLVPTDQVPNTVVTSRRSRRVKPRRDSQYVYH